MNWVQRVSSLRRRWIVVLHDLVWVPVCIFLACWLRFNLGVVPTRFIDGLFVMVAFALPLHALTFWFFGCYRGIWRFASIPDFLRILKAVAVGGVGAGAFVLFVLGTGAVPRSVLVLYPVLLVIGVSMGRLGYRIIKDRHLRLSVVGSDRALIVGAGRAGEALIRDLVRNGSLVPVALVDDDRHKQGNEIHGVRVSGTLDSVGTLMRDLDVDVVLVAMVATPRQKLEEIIYACADAGVLCRIMPGFGELAHGRFTASRMRPVTVEDLLGREPIKLDYSRVSAFLTGKRVLVTGGGGSIGSELCRQLADIDPELLIIVDHSEFNLYQIEQELLVRKRPVNFVKVLSDVRNDANIETLFRHYAPQVVFHAAAYKHVPMVEDNPSEGVFNNVFGTQIVADAAVRQGAEHFVMVSTDKTVNPTSIMGTTKRIAELYCQALGKRTDTNFITTRFGNVLGSTGSVVPHFEKQIKRGGPVTVTHADVTRYFMTISEAVSLILQAGAIGQGGDIFVLDMGEPVRIRDLAEKMIRLSGLTPGRDIEIAYTGLRPGEKMHEELFYKAETLRGTTYPKLMLASSCSVDWDALETAMAELKKAARAADETALNHAMHALVPEYESCARNVSGKAPLRVVK